MVRYPSMLAALALLPGLAYAANLDKELISNSEEVLVALRKAKVKVVGVLPFDVKRGARPASYHAAPLSGSITTRLENALILRHGGGKTGVVLVRGASSDTAWAGKQEAFDALFTTQRDPAWGEGKVKADAFLTGTISNTGDRKTTKVEVRLVRADSMKDGKLAAEALHSFDVRTDRSLLRDLGYNFAPFLARKLKPDANKDDLDDAAIEQVKNEDEGKKKEPKPKEDEGSHTPADVGGMRLEIEYDGVKQAIQSNTLDVEGARQTRYFVAAPKVGQKVVIFLTRISKGDEKLGAVLKVNGRSTYLEETDEAVACKKWIYPREKEGKREEYAGFYRKEGDELKVREFKVLTAKEAEEASSELGTRGGWIDLDVFTTRDKDDPVDEEIVLTTRGLAKGKYATLKSLREALARSNRVELPKIAPRSVEGAMVGDVKELPAGKAGTDKLPNPVRLAGISIRYVQPATGGKLVED